MFPEILYSIASEYNINNNPRYFKVIPRKVTFQPHVYKMAQFIAERARIENIIDIGGGDGHKLKPFVGQFTIYAVDHGENYAMLSRIRGIKAVEWDLENGLPTFDEDVLRNSIVIAADVVEHLREPDRFFRELSLWAKLVKYLLLSTPDRTRVQGAGNLGPPANDAHVREWTMDEFSLCLRKYGIAHPLMGHTINTEHQKIKHTLLAIAGVEPCPTVTKPVSCLALISIYNEADMIIETVDHLLKQEIDVHVIDNWSTDSGYELLMDRYSEDQRVTLSRFPEALTGRHEWARMLDHKVFLSRKSGYDWIMHYDADELRYSPWPGFNLNRAMAWVDALGYNAIDFTVVNFRFCMDTQFIFPTYEQNLLRYEFGRRAGHFKQIKAWKNSVTETPVLSKSGGHECAFPNRCIFPLKFLTKHYPLRSPEQAIRKIKKERLPRVEWAQKKYGWHGHYKIHENRPFHWDDHALNVWSDSMFYSDCIVERLSGIGIARERFVKNETSNSVESLSVSQLTIIKDLNQVTKDLSQAKSELENCTQRERQLKKELHAIRTSLSWRLTAPWRKLMIIIRKFKP